MTGDITWTHPSVRRLLEQSAGRDPFEEITRRARDIVLDALESGWQGPPFDPFELAARAGISTVPRDDLEDARLVSAPDERPRIEFNPRRRPARVRFSVAHEIGHLLFTDHGNRTRYRSASHSENRRADDWQLEVLCNVAAAEVLMPAGAFPLSQADDLSLPHLLDLRAVFGVSTEALLRRVVRLTERPACLFACARLPEGGFRVDYAVPSRAWQHQVRSGSSVPPGTVLARCTAVGYSVDQQERWPGIEGSLRVQAVGVPPYPGDSFPRVVGLLTSQDESPRRVSGVRYVRGDATVRVSEGPTMIAHIVNNAARRWGGQGFARAMGRRAPVARDAYASWASVPEHRRLGAVHVAEAAPDLWVASMVAQAGYGDAAASRPRLRLRALAQCLATVADEARRRGAAVQMPPVGVGQGATPWPTVRDLILEHVVDQGIAVTVRVLESEPMPEETVPSTPQQRLELT
jgi:hypothetical protein